MNMDTYLAAYTMGFHCFERHIGKTVADVDDLNPYLQSHLRDAFRDGWHHAYQAYWIDAAEYAA
jgi:hypothetical protein